MSVEVTKLGLQAALCTALAAVMIGGCGGPVDEDSTEQAFAASASRLQNQEAQFLRRCLSVTGDEGTRVRTAICSQLDENQGIIYAAGSTKQWLQGQTTGRAKCLAVTAVGNIIHAVCAENTASQRWVKVPHSDRFSYTYQNAGRCLTLNASGALSAASCDSESLAQRWRTGVDRTLDEVFSYGVVSSADVPTQAPDLTIPATQETIDYTGGAITRWEATYISFQPQGWPMSRLAWSSLDGIASMLRASTSAAFMSETQPSRRTFITRGRSNSLITPAAGPRRSSP